MAFFAESPITVIMPTLKYTSFGMPLNSTAAVAPIKPNGTIISTASGIVQLSYSAASTMNTASTDKPISNGVCRVATVSSRAAFNQSNVIARRQVGREPLHLAIAAPELWPREARPLISSDG